MLVIVITSSEIALSPGFRFSTGVSMNGSSLVPAPLMKSGSEVVYSGSGPFAISISNLSLCNRSGISNNRSKIKSRGKQIIQLHPPDALELSLIQLPSLSVFGVSSAFSGSVLQSASALSETPSLSSSRSALFPIRSPSVSNHSDALDGNISGPGTQSEIGGEIGPSQYPSPSVSGSHGLEPVSASEM